MMRSALPACSDGETAAVQTTGIIARQWPNGQRVSRDVRDRGVPRLGLTRLGPTACRMSVGNEAETAETRRRKLGRWMRCQER